MRNRRIAIIHLAALCLLLLRCVFTPEVAAAHEATDAATGPTPGTMVPRMTAQSPDFELVATPTPGGLTLYLDRFASNEPVIGATITVTVDGVDDIAHEAMPAIYTLGAPWLQIPGKHDLVFALAVGEINDLLIGSIEVPASVPHPAAVADIPDFPHLAASVSAPNLASFALGALAMLVLLRAGGWLRRFGRALGIGLLVLLIVQPAHAHGGHDDGDNAPVISGDAPRRLPDGSVFLPKPAQHFLTIRTIAAIMGDGAKTTRLVGQVIADPSASGRVQATQSGRLEAGPTGLPHLGTRVSKGQILAVLAPAIGTLDRNNAQQQMTDIDNQIRLAEQKVARMNGLSGSIAQKEIDDARTELDGLRKRRETMAPALGRKEMLLAPVGGVVAASSAALGQLVEAKDILFEIIDPNQLWVEAITFDPQIGTHFTAATGMTGDGQTLQLNFIGQGLTLRQQALPLQFQINHPPASLAVGTPVTVIAQGMVRQTGIILPQVSIVRGTGGQMSVWVHTAPELFVPRAVRAEPLDGDHVLILDGIAVDQRIVTDGAALLNQVR